MADLLTKILSKTPGVCPRCGSNDTYEDGTEATGIDDDSRFYYLEMACVECGLCFAIRFKYALTEWEDGQPDEREEGNE